MDENTKTLLIIFVFVVITILLFKPFNCSKYKENFDAKLPASSEGQMLGQNQEQPVQLTSEQPALNDGSHPYPFMISGVVDDDTNDLYGDYNQDSDNNVSEENNSIHDVDSLVQSIDLFRKNALSGQ